MATIKWYVQPAPTEEEAAAQRERAEEEKRTARKAKLIDDTDLNIGRIRTF